MLSYALGYADLANKYYVITVINARRGNSFPVVYQRLIIAPFHYDYGFISDIVDTAVVKKKREIRIMIVLSFEGRL